MKLKIIQSVCCAFLLIGANVVSAETTEISKETKEAIQVVGKETNFLSQAGAALALKTLQDTGKLGPFAVVLENNDEIKVIKPTLDFVNQAPFAEKINFLRGQVKHRAEQGLIKAGAVYSRGHGRTAADKTKNVAGIIIEQEHKRGPSTLQFVPYEKKDGKYTVLTATSKPKPRLFFNNAISSQKAYEAIKKQTAKTADK